MAEQIESVCACMCVYVYIKEVDVALMNANLLIIWSVVSAR